MSIRNYICLLVMIAILVATVSLFLSSVASLYACEITTLEPAFGIRR